MIVAGKITYWEHAGLMDDADYANDFVRKVNTYANNDLLLGRDVVLSYETQELGCQQGRLCVILQMEIRC